MNVGKIILKESNKISASMCIIGPDEASELLKLNTHNRDISQNVVDKYVSEMQMGEWLPTAAGIGIDETGVLTDGQHRLHEVVKYGGTVQMLIVTGLPCRSQMKQDRHNKRNLAAVFKLSGICDNKFSVQTATMIANGNTGRGLVSDSVIEAAVNSNRESLSVICGILKGNRKGVAQVGVRAALTQAHKIYPAEAEVFAESLFSEAYIPKSKGDPIYRLKKCLKGGTGSISKGTGGGSRQSWAYGRTCYAFNAYIEGKEIASVHSADSITKGK